MDLPGDSAADVSRFSCENAPRMPLQVRRLLIGAAIALIAIVAGLALPALRGADSLGLESCERCLDLARLVPADADEVAIIPAGGGLWFAMMKHPIREDRIFGSETRGTIVAIALGRNPVVVWKRDDRMGAAVFASAPRRSLIRLALPPTLRGQVSTKGGAIVVGSSQGGFPIEELAGLAQAPGQLFIAHRRRPSIPGVIAPAFSSHALERDVLSVVSRSRDESAAVRPLPNGLRHPASAVLSVALGSVQGLGRDWERVLPVDSRGMGAGLVAIFGVESGMFLPRVRGVVIAESTETDPVALLDRLVPAVDGAVSSVRRRDDVVIARREAMGLVGEAALVDGRAVLSLDSTSMDRFLAERVGAAPFAKGAEWSLKAKPAELRLAIRNASESLGYKLLGKRTRNKVRSLSRTHLWDDGPLWATLERTRTGGEARVTCRVEW